VIPTPTLTRTEADAWRPALVDHTSADILAWYHAVAQVLRRDAVCVEVGVAHGRSVLFLAEILAALGRDAAKVYAVDTWGYPAHDEPEAVFPHCFSQVLQTWVENASMVELEHVCPVRARSVDASRLFRRRSVDLVMIDASHDVGSVGADIEAWWPRVRVGGWLSGHDYRPENPGVVSAVDAFFRGRVVVYDTVWVVPTVPN
jgi:cephalosporin hydroxylase